MTTIILQGPDIEQQTADNLAAEINGSLEKFEHYFKITTISTIQKDQLTALREKTEGDVNFHPEGFDASNIRLLIMDMDSTFINIECVDEIADFANCKPEVAAITESAMRGEIDFETSLTQRMKLLTGLSTDALLHVYEERLQLNPGAEVMLAGLRSKGIKVALVSGGFSYFTERLKQKYKLDYTLSNELEIVDGQLTGNIKGNIVGADSKARFLLKLCDELNIKPDQVVAMGDGANDLKMMMEAGLSIAYHAKPAVQAQADTALNYCGLEGVLGLLEINN